MREDFPFEAVQTNIVGPENIVRAIREQQLPVETVIGISTDKACKPISLMGMTKAVQERIFISANLDCPNVRFVAVRYGNVLASRGSVIPLFHDQIRHGGPVTVTHEEMTRFLLSLNDAVDTVLTAYTEANRGEIYVPIAPCARMIDVATTLVGSHPIAIKVVGVRPGEKMHEILVSEEEIHHTTRRGDYYAILPMLPELQIEAEPRLELKKEFSSADRLMTSQELLALLEHHHLLYGEGGIAEEGELLR